MAEHPNCPMWVSEEPCIQALLTRLLDRHERKVKNAFVVNKKNLPLLFDFEGDTEHLWRLINELQNHQIIEIKPGPRSPNVEAFERAKIFFQPKQEGLVRAWLNRPEVDPAKLAWFSAIETMAGFLGPAAAELYQHLAIRPGITADEIVQGYCKIKPLLMEPIALRTLSAKCFWGDSKFLDKRETLVRSLYPELSHNLLGRKLLINIYLPEGNTLDQMVFIENQDSFHELCSSPRQFENIAFVYSAGFMASAERIRSPDQVIFSYVNTDREISCQQFECSWFAVESDTTACHFWGDLDYSGMSILIALKKVFKNIDAWQPGYVPMLRHFDDGLLHGANSTKKQGQKVIVETGCPYADKELIPRLMSTKCFLDQEVISPWELEIEAT